MNRNAPTVRVARWSAIHPWRAIALWLVFVTACFAVGQMAGMKTATDEQLGVGQSGRQTAIVHDGKLVPRATENVVITPRSGKLDLPQAKTAAAEATGRMRDLSQVTSVAPPIRAPGGNALLVPVTMRSVPDDAADHVDPLLKQTRAVQHDHPNLRVEEAGDGSINKGVNDEVANELQKSERLSLPVTLGILLVAFGAIVAAGVPVLLAISAVGAAIGLSGVASQFVPAVDTVNSVILMIGMAVGVDYSLFYLKREREERARGNGKVDAIEIAAATSGHSVVVSGLAVIASMVGLYMANDAIFSSIATGTIIVVAIAMLGSLTVLPALLAKLGRAVDRPRVPLVWRLTNRTGAPRLWPALLRPALRRPKVALVGSVVALIALALPALTLRLHSEGVNDFPQHMPVVQAYKHMTAAFPNENSSFDIAVKAPAGTQPEVTAALGQVQQRVQSDPAFVHGESLQTRVSADGRVRTFTVDSPYGETSKKAKTALQDLRNNVLPPTVGKVSGAEWAVGGDVASNVDYADHVKDKLPVVMGFVMLLAFIMMAVTFRSIVVALTAVTINALSAAAAFGVLGLTFQHTWADGLIGQHTTAGIISWLPLFLFVVLFGLSMDYHVFVVSRIKEAADGGMSTKDAVAHGITRSAGVVTSAAIVMVSVFGIFGTLDMLDMKQLGIGLATAVLIDAMVVRIVVLPSLMALLGRANWWPGRLSRKSRRHAASQLDERELQPIA